MYGDPLAKFYYPDELRWFRARAFLVGLAVGAVAGVIVFSVWLM
jgi:hypothetical protein